MNLLLQFSLKTLFHRAFMLALMREFFPSVRSVGTLFIPSEVNSVYLKDQLTKQAQEVGLEVIAVAASTSAEVPDAALSLAPVTRARSAPA